jgi:hypothetical protein
MPQSTIVAGLRGLFSRVDLIGRYAQVGLARLVAFPARWSPTEATQSLFAEDCLAAGIKLERA